MPFVYLIIIITNNTNTFLLLSSISGAPCANESQSVGSGELKYDESDEYLRISIQF